MIVSGSAQRAIDPESRVDARVRPLPASIRVQPREESVASANGLDNTSRDALDEFVDVCLFAFLS